MPPDSRVALLSTTDPTGLQDLARALAAAGYRIVATRGTAKVVRDAGVVCEEIETLTGFPEMLGGRVKTLHPHIFGGILARDEPGDAEELSRHGIAPVAVVVVNLYRFESAAAAAPERQVLEEIDIGGVALLRAAAKNFERVSVLADPALYPAFIAALVRGGTTRDERRVLAAQAFSIVARYDAAIAAYFARVADSGELPEVLTLALPIQSRLRYGENPWATAAFYHGDSAGLPKQLGGKTLSYNNLLDVDSCLRLIAPIEEPVGFPQGALPGGRVSAAIVKHTVPCGLAAADTASDALTAALGADPISAYGGIVAVNATIDETSARILKPRFVEVVAAPAFDPSALALLATKRNLRLLSFEPSVPARLRAGMTLRSALGGVLAERPDPLAPPDEWRVMTDKKPDVAGWRDLLFAFGAVRQIKSNAAVVAHHQVTLGICGGQTNRVAAVELACRRSGNAARGAVLATDGYFPFADGIEAAIAFGVVAVVAPSGSIRDAEVVEAARRGGIVLVFASRRYFLH